MSTRHPLDVIADLRALRCHCPSAQTRAELSRAAITLDRVHQGGDAAALRAATLDATRVLETALDEATP